jgi:KDO2-lipid IV(A) lauroyltransferase
MPKQHSPSLFAPRGWPLWCLLGVAWLIGRLPITWIIAIGKLLGRSLYWLSGLTGASRRQITDTNIELCFPELTASARAELARDSFIHTVIGALEITQPWLNPGRNLRDRITLHGVEHLQRAAAQGRGVLLVGGHFSTLDIVAQGVTAAVDLDVMYRRNRNPVWEWLQVRSRKRYFDGVIEREDTRQTLQRLKAGRIIWYAADQDYGAKHSVFAPFFGIETATINATVRLAAFNQSPVIFMSNFRDPDTCPWSAHFTPVLENYPSGDDLADATRMNAIIESAVREHPEQYLWMHRRFKTRPPGAQKIY